MIFKWGDASNITLSSSFDNFSFHGDTTFPLTVQSMQMHITVKMCGATKHQSCPDGSCWGRKKRVSCTERQQNLAGANMVFKVQKDTSFTLNHKTLQADETKLKATIRILLIHFAVVAEFCFLFLFCLFVRVRRAWQAWYRLCSGEQLCGGDMPAAWGTMPYLSGWATVQISVFRRPVTSHSGNHRKVQSSFFCCHNKKKKKKTCAATILQIFHLYLPETTLTDAETHHDRVPHRYFHRNARETIKSFTFNRSVSSGGVPIWFHRPAGCRRSASNIARSVLTSVLPRVKGVERTRVARQDAKAFL